MSVREDQKQKREEEILEASLELFIKKGYAGTKTSEIAKAVQMSDGLLFHYFKSKEVLYETLVNIAMETSKGWIDIDNIDPMTYLEQVTSSVFSCVQEDSISAKFFIFVAQIKQREGVPAHILEKVAEREKDITKLVAIIERGQAMKQIRKGDSLALAYMFNATLQGIAIQYAHHPETPLPDVQWILAMLKA